MANKKIGIQELITAVSTELHDKPVERDMMFFVEKVELEIAFTVESDASGEVNLHVVKAGGGVKATDVQKVTISLLPYS